ncbi:hypothetical protein POX_d05346 [Penicillium oxalicum]|uniref:hypothetical protein n=1 Tax=Penicillium oxalicum TaxID=69781 RepID=UPI0020B6664E|nr:hypothetical protein POX_d05346 [Penicillium oxalicum]KAI2789848.1 hypothetical protein POX_d05346 [Penicillium oxalicum]
MGWFGDDSDEAQAYKKITQRPDRAEVSHTLLGDAAAYEAGKAYEDHVAANGHPDEYSQAKEIVLGAIGAFVDREVETQGLDHIDRERAKHLARGPALEELNSRYGDRW